MADDIRTPAQADQQRNDDARKGKPKVAASDDLKSLAQAQRPRGALGRIKAEGEDPRADRPGALPMPHRRNVSAYTPAPAIERWNADAAGVRAVEYGDNVITMFGPIGEDFWTGEGVTAKRVTAQLRAIGQRPVEVHINSFGGDMFEGIAPYNNKNSVFHQCLKPLSGGFFYGRRHTHRIASKSLIRHDATGPNGCSTRHRRDKECDMTEPPAPSDLLYGVPAIGAFLGISARQARHLADSGAVPTFKLPGNKIICARRSSLNAWLAEREAAARAGRADG